MSWHEPWAPIRPWISNVIVTLSSANVVNHLLKYQKVSATSSTNDDENESIITSFLIIKCTKDDGRFHFGNLLIIITISSLISCLMVRWERGIWLQYLNRKNRHSIETFRRWSLFLCLENGSFLFCGRAGVNHRTLNKSNR